MGTQLGGGRVGGDRVGPGAPGTGHPWGASGKAAPQVRLSEERAHRQALHGWLTVYPWQLVIYHCWAAMSGGNMINFTLPFSEISPINHPKLGLCAGFPFRPVWQIFTRSHCPAQALSCFWRCGKRRSLSNRQLVDGKCSAEDWWKEKWDRYTCWHI